jgi:hypothetical protein
MMKNNFKINNYTGLHEFGCLYCEFLERPENWPDINKVTRCRKHCKKLVFLLNDEGYFIHDEWFCKDIEIKKIPQFHKTELEKIKPGLKQGFLYCLSSNEIGIK